MEKVKMLIDNLGRVHDYLRISLTDVCNFRCTYCMPDENMCFMPASHLMSADEIDKIAEEFVKMGVKKIRLTGGEPLVRKDVADIIQRLSKYPVELTMTTNGSKVDDYIEVFEKAGIRSVNVSLDTLDKEKFQLITRRNVFDKVLNNIQLLIDRDFHVKVNMVVMRGVNDNEILDFIKWTKHQPVHVRFIEFMPFAGNQWENEKLFPYQEMLDVIADQYSFIRLKDDVNGTAKKFKLLNHAGSFAVISTMSAPFCSNCNRMRLTADGKMKNCLFSKGEMDLLSAFRNNEDITPMVAQCVYEKKEALGGQFTTEHIEAGAIENRSMISIGG